MKAFDTPVLLAVLEGSTKARAAVRKLRGTELATTEANLLELVYLAANAPPKARSARLAAVEKLRQRLTVLPIDARSVREASARVSRLPDRIPPTVACMLGALQAAGCDELITDRSTSVAGDWGFRLTRLTL